ncbi:MAG: F0F1 ATP synthase subunit alpha, partial [Acidimicrobiia bacterium]
MTDLNINAGDIAAALRKNLEGFSPTIGKATVGRIAEVGDGIARVTGLPGCAVNELLEFEDGTKGLALNLDEESIGAVVLGDVDNINEGQSVRATGDILSVPCGDGLLGRVVDALGNPVDGKGPLTNVSTRRMEIQAPGIMGRQPVHEPLQTGIKAIDSMTPIGRGQRELIIGDRKTGKTVIAIDTILNQKGLGVKCVYVAIGQKESTVAQTVNTLTEHGAMDYTVVVVAGGSDPA